MSENSTFRGRGAGIWLTASMLFAASLCGCGQSAEQKQKEDAALWQKYKTPPPGFVEQMEAKRQAAEKNAEQKPATMSSASQPAAAPASTAGQP